MSLLSNWNNGDLISVIRDTTNAAINTIGKLLVSNTDTTFGYLINKLVAGAGITITKNNAGGNETITITGPDISGKLNISSIIIASTSASGPVSYPTTTDTVILTLTPSASKSAALMKYTFMGYLENNVVDTATIKIKKNGVLMQSTKTTVPNGQLNFCLTFTSSYTANDIITATVVANADGGDIVNCVLMCEAFDAI